MKGIKEFKKFTRFLFHEHDISKTNLKISKPQIAVLMLMDEHRGKPMSAISREIGLEKSSFTRCVDQLVAAGFITKERSSKDRRIINIVFTEKGNAAVNLIKEDWAGYFETLIAVLSDKEKAAFAEAVETVSHYMNLIMAKNRQPQPKANPTETNAPLPKDETAL